MAQPIPPESSSTTKSPIDIPEGRTSDTLLHSGHSVTQNRINETVTKPTYASLVNPDEGTALEFIPVADINGVKCAKVELEDIEEEVNYWQNAVICCVLGANPPISVMEGFVKRIWREFPINKVLLVKKGLYLIRFEDYQDTLKVIQQGFYLFDQKPFIVKPWTPEMEINTEAISSLPIWVRFPELDIKYWGLQSLSKIGSMLGIPLKTDRFTKDKMMLRYARLLIEMPLDGQFPEFLEFANEKGVLIRQKIQYEWIPIKCTYCRMFGHPLEDCRKKNPQRMEWRVRTNHTQPDQPAQQISTDTEEGEGGFQQVTRHVTRRGGDRTGDSAIEANHTNPFNTLRDEIINTGNVGQKEGHRGLSPNG